MTELPYMPVYVHELLGEIAGLDDAERGAYLSLRLTCWGQGGSLPNDPKRLARLAGTDPARWAAIWASIGGKFEVQGDIITHAGVTASLARARELQEARRRGAAATNAQRGAQRAPSERSAVGISGQVRSGQRSGKGKAKESPPGGDAAAPRANAQPYIALFCDLWVRKYGRPYLVQPRDAGAVAKLLKARAIALAMWESMIARYLADAHPAKDSHPLERLANNPNAWTGPNGAVNGSRDPRVGHVPAENKPRPSGVVDL